MCAEVSAASEVECAHRRSSSDKVPSPLQSPTVLTPSKKKSLSGSFLRNHFQSASTPASPEEQSLPAAAKTRVSGFPLPIFSSTPLGNPQGLFAHKRRSSAGIDHQKSSESKPQKSSQQNASSTEMGGNWLQRLKSGSRTWKHSSAEVPSEEKTEEAAPVELAAPESVKLPTPPQRPLSPNRQQQASAGSTAHSVLLESGASQTQHNFLLDDKDLRSMERNLLSLLDDFQSGKLRAFVKDDTMMKMCKIREQQEQLAKLHFELYAEQTEESEETNAARLADRLQEIHQSLEQLSRSRAMPR